MEKEVEGSRIFCDRIAYCGFYPKIISDEMREKYCHLRKEVCCKNNAFVRGIFSLQNSFNSKP